MPATALTSTTDQDGIVWYDIRQFGVLGQGWPESAAPFHRLPPQAQALVRPVVWDLSLHSAGLNVRFASDTEKMLARWHLRNDFIMPHMPATGISGLDLYIQREGNWRWASTGRPEAFPECRSTLFAGLAPRMREYRLYLPLYNGVTKVEVGIPAGTAIRGSAPDAGKPICFYGTSIVQGGCASRAGMTYPAILGRRLGRETINLGFSGNGPMELEIARFLTELDVACYVVDCLPNMEPAQVEERAEPFVAILRAARPSTPIIFIENINHQDSIHFDEPRRDRRNNRALRAAYDRMQAAGVRGLAYIAADDLLGHDGEGTVDGVHPTDLGFLRFADAIEPAIRQVC
jgi:hypothetical protein